LHYIRTKEQQEVDFVISRAKELSGFEARTTFEDSLKKTIEWWKSQGGISDPYG